MSRCGHFARPPPKKPPRLGFKIAVQFISELMRLHEYDLLDRVDKSVGPDKKYLEAWR